MFIVNVFMKTKLLCEKFINIFVIMKINISGESNNWIFGILLTPHIYVVKHLFACFLVYNRYVFEGLFDLKIPFTFYLLSCNFFSYTRGFQSFLMYGF